MKEFAEAVRLDPGLACAHYNLGKTLAVLKKTDWAVSEYKEALRADPGMNIAYFDMGLALEESDKPDEAVIAYRAFIDSSGEEYGKLRGFTEKRISELGKPFRKIGSFKKAAGPEKIVQKEHGVSQSRY